MKISPPKAFGHSLRTTLIENQCYIAIIIDRKSRLIMKDKRFILELSKKIQTVINIPVRVNTLAPVCSKTRKFL